MNRSMLKSLNKLKSFFVVALCVITMFTLISQVNNLNVLGQEDASQITPSNATSKQVTKAGYLNDYLIRYTGIRFGGTSNATGAPITIQSGASIDASVAFTLNSETGTTTSSGTVEKGRIAFRFQLPSNVAIQTSTGVFNYQEGSASDPSGTFDGGAYRYYWAILSENLDIGSGSIVSLTLTPFVNGTTNDATSVSLHVDAYDYYGGVATPVGFVEGGQTNTLTNTIHANTDKFAWNDATLTLTPTGINATPSQSTLPDMRFSLSTASNTTSLTSGVGYAKSVHFSSTFEIPVDSNGVPYLSLSASNFYQNDGTTLLDPNDVTFDNVNHTFTVKQTLYNPDTSKEFVSPTYPFVIKNATIDKTSTDLSGMVANETKTFQLSALSGSNQIDALVTLDATITTPFVVGQKSTTPVTITYKVPAVQTGKESYVAPQKNITSINSSSINGTDQNGKYYTIMPGDKISYQLGVEHFTNLQDVTDANGGIIQSMSYSEVAGVNYNASQLLLQSITFGGIQQFTSGTATIKVTYSDATIDTKQILPGDPSNVSFVLPIEKRAMVAKYEILYENVNAGFRLNTGPQTTYTVIDQKDITKNGAIISNSVTSTYQNTLSNVNNVTATSAPVKLIYNQINMINGRYEFNKTGTNLGKESSSELPIKDDVVLFTIQLKNTTSSNMAIDSLDDVYTNAYLDPYNGTTSKVGGSSAIDTRYLNATNLINLTYWQSDPSVASNAPIALGDMSVTQSGVDNLHVDFATPINIPAGKTYYLTYTMSTNVDMTPNATLGNTFQAFYDGSSVANGAFYWGPSTTGGATSLKSAINVTGPAGVVDNWAPYGGDVLVFKATIKNQSGNDWGPNMKVTDTFSSNLIPYSVDSGFNTTGPLISSLNLNTTLNLGVSKLPNENTAQTIDSNISATITGTNTFEYNLGNSILKDGQQLTFYYTMQVASNVKTNDTYNNSYVVFDDQNSQLTSAAVSGRVNALQDYKSLVSVVKGAETTASNAPNHPSTTLRDGDEIEYTIAVSNYKLQPNGSISFQSIVDNLPSNMTYVPNSIDIKYQTLTRQMNNNNESDFTNNPIVSTTPQALPNEAQSAARSVGVDSNNILKISFANPVPLSNRYFDNTYSKIMEYQYLITYKLKVHTNGIPQSTRLLNQVNEAKVFFTSPSTDLKQINGTLLSDESDLDGNPASLSYVKNTASVTLLNDNFVYAGITKNAINNITGANVAGNRASNNANVDVGSTRIYNITVENAGGKDLPIAKVTDVLPEYETIVPGSVVLIKDVNAPAISEPMLYSVGSIVKNGKTYQTITTTSFTIPSTSNGANDYQIRYQTNIDTVRVKNNLTQTQTSSMSGFVNSAAFYVQSTNGVEPSVILSNLQGTQQGDDGVAPNEDWDNNPLTAQRYQFDEPVTYSGNYITPLIDLKAENVSRVLGSSVEAYHPYTSTTTIEPGEIVAWNLKIGNGNQADTQTLLAGSRVFLVLPEGLTYLGFGQDVGGVESVPSFLDAASYVQSSDAFGNTILSWTTTKDYEKNTSDFIRIRTKTKAFTYTAYQVKGYFVPLQGANQEFYDAQLETSNEYKTLIYDHANEFVQLAKLDASYITKTHYVDDNAGIDVYGNLGVAAMLSERDTVNGTIVTSRDDNRTMDVKDKNNLVTYTMDLESVQGSAEMKDIVFVDRLPSLGDARNLGLNPRGSEADARLVGDGNFVVRYTQTGTSPTIILDAAQYRVEYFMGDVTTQFHGDDYKDVAMPSRWLSGAEVLASGKDYVDATAIRVVITDSNVIIGGLGNIQVDFDVKLDHYFIGGKQAINTFGYRTIVGVDTELIAEVLPVSFDADILLDRVLIQKTLIDDTDTPKNTSFEVQVIGKDKQSGEVLYDQLHTVITDTRTSTGWSGETWVYELPFGLDYSVIEVQNPNFKAPVYADATKEVSADTTTAWTFGITNERDPLVLKAQKIWHDVHGDVLADDTYQSDVIIELYQEDATGAPTGNVIDRVLLTKDNDYQASFKAVDRLEADGTPIAYTVQEVALPGFISTQSFDAATGTFQVTNTLKSGSVEMNKTSNKEGVSLAGATFALYDSNNNILGFYATNDAGKFEVGMMNPGEYHFVETKALSQHLLNKNQLDFNVPFNAQETIQVFMENTFIEQPKEPIDPVEPVKPVEPIKPISPVTPGEIIQQAPKPSKNHPNTSDSSVSLGMLLGLGILSSCLLGLVIPKNKKE